MNLICTSSRKHYLNACLFDTKSKCLRKWACIHIHLTMKFNNMSSQISLLPKIIWIYDMISYRVYCVCTSTSAVKIAIDNYLLLTWIFGHKFDKNMIVPLKMSFSMPFHCARMVSGLSTNLTFNYSSFFCQYLINSVISLWAYRSVVSDVRMTYPPFVCVYVYNLWTFLELYRFRLGLSL